jgi:hypothetical protein
MAYTKRPDDMSSNVKRDNSDDDTLRLRPSDFGSSRQKSDSDYDDTWPSRSKDDTSYEGRTGSMSGRGSQSEH